MTGKWIQGRRDSVEYKMQYATIKATPNRNFCAKTEQCVERTVIIEFHLRIRYFVAVINMHSWRDGVGLGAQFMQISRGIMPTKN